MTAEADEAFFVEEAGMALVVNGVGVGLSGFGSHIVALASLADIAIDEDFAIQGDGDVVALGTDFLVVPLA